MARTHGSCNGGRRSAPRRLEAANLELLAVHVEQHNDLAIVRPRGELDLGTVAMLRAALDAVRGMGRLVLDLRRLSFIDCAGVNLLVAQHQRAQRDDVQLTLLAPAAPADRAIRLSGLDQTLPFEAPVETPATQPGKSASEGDLRASRAEAST